MGNTLSMIGDWPPSLVAITTAWAAAVVFACVKVFILKPWGSIAQARRSIERCEKKRSDGFEEWNKTIFSTDQPFASIVGSVSTITSTQKIQTEDEDVLTKRREIVALPLLQLREALQTDKLTAILVLEAYVWKALQVQERLNCCTEIIREAFDTAREMDEKWSGKEEKPCLYGVPFSVKSNFHMKGYDCSIGLTKWLDQPKSQDCSFVTHLRNLGAVPFVLTNVPQGLLSFVCSNSVYGTTSNPHDATRTPGGSSGGEAALLGGGGSPFGIGSDLAGSLRIPATLCGVVSLKPTQDRFVVTGSHGGVPGRGRLGLSFGFFTKTVDEQIYLLQTTIGTREYREVTPLSIVSPLDVVSIQAKRPMRIGYFEDDRFCRPVPSMRRSVLDTVEGLKKNGHTMVRFQVPEVDNMVELLYKTLMPDGGAYARSLYDNEVVDPYMKQFVTMLKIPRCVRWIASLLISRVSPQMSAIAASYVSDLEDLRYSQEKVDEYRLKFIAYWKSLEIDALVCPAFPVAAVPHEYPSRLSTVAVSTGLFNLIDFPAGVVPTGKVTTEDDKKLLDEKEFPCGYNLALRLQRDASRASVGLPCAVQVVGLPFEEETCLRLMAEVEQMWNN